MAVKLINILINKLKYMVNRLVCIVYPKTKAQDACRLLDAEPK